MPLPKPKRGEPRKDFLERCMGNDTMNSEYPDNKQRYAVCNSLWRRRQRDAESDEHGEPNRSPTMANYRCGDCGVEGIAGEVEHLEGCSRLHTQTAEPPALSKLEFGGELMLDTKSINSDTREVGPHKVSSPLLDRQQDIVEPKGWKLDEYKRNPVVVADHRYELERIIGKNVSLKIADDGLWAVTKFNDIGLGAHAFNLVEKGLARGWSVGFKGDEAHSIREGVKNKCAVCKKVQKQILKGREPDEVFIHGRHFTEQTLYEYSLVAVPANSDAVMQALRKGLVDESSAEILFRLQPEGWEQKLYERLDQINLQNRAQFEQLQLGITSILDTVEETVAHALSDIIESIQTPSKTFYMEPGESSTATVAVAPSNDASTKTTAQQETVEEENCIEEQNTQTSSTTATSEKNVDRLKRMDAVLRIRDALRKQNRGRFIRMNTPQRRKT